MIGILVTAATLFGVRFLGKQIVDPVRDNDFISGYWTGLVATCAAFLINTIL